MPGKRKTSEDWSAETKFSVVVEMASMNESTLSKYCRSKGLYPEQIKASAVTAALLVLRKNSMRSGKKTRTINLNSRAAKTGKADK